MIADSDWAVESTRDPDVVESSLRDVEVTSECPWLVTKISSYFDPLTSGKLRRFENEFTWIHGRGFNL